MHFTGTKSSPKILLKTQTLLISFVQLNLSKYSKRNIILTILSD